MAEISSPFVGIAKGKLGEGVYYRAGGKTLARARNRNPRNPKSTAQCQQRLVFSSATRTAKALRGIIDHSFEDIEYGQASVNFFTKQAVAVLKQHMQAPIVAGGTPYVPALPLGTLTGNGVEMVLAEFPISQGSLPQVVAPIVALDEEEGPDGAHALRISSVAITATTEVAQLASLGFEKGKQYTFILISDKGQKEDGTYSYNVPGEMTIARINFKADVANSTTLFVTAGEGIFTINPAVLDPKTSTNYSKVHFMTGSFAGTCVADDSNDIVAGCIIASEYVDGKWRRSSQVLQTLREEVLDNLPVSKQYVENLIMWNSLTDLLNSIVGEGSYATDWYLNKEPNA